MHYLSHWPEYIQVAESPSGEIMGYSKFICFQYIHVNKASFHYLKLTLLFEIIKVMGKAEGHGENWHGHVTALTVSPDYRRLGLAAMLMKYLEDVSEK